MKSSKLKTNEQLIAEFNKVRSEQRHNFSSVQDLLTHAKEIASKKAQLLAQLENLNR